MSLSHALMDSGAHPTGIGQGTILELPNAQLRMELDMMQGRPACDKRRLVIAAESDAHCRDKGAGTLLVIPITSGISVKRSTAMPLPASTPGLDEDSLALVHIVQPVPRSVCRPEYVVGSLRAEQVDELRARLADIFGTL